MVMPLENPLEELVDHTGATPGAMWKATGTAAGIVGAIAVRKLLDRLNVKAAELGEETDPSQRRFGWGYALLWAGVVGIGATAGRIGAQAIVAQRVEAPPLGAREAVTVTPRSVSRRAVAACGSGCAATAARSSAAACAAAAWPAAPSSPR